MSFPEFANKGFTRAQTRILKRWFYWNFYFLESPTQSKSISIRQNVTKKFVELRDTVKPYDLVRAYIGH